MKVKSLIVLFCSYMLLPTSFAEQRFGRPIVKVRDSKSYLFNRTDDVKYPTLSDERFTVSCLVFRGTERYYTEVVVTNKTQAPVWLPKGFIAFEKPGYTVYPVDTMMVAREEAAGAGATYVPTRAPYVPSTYNTTVNATAYTYGNQTNVSGTATTTADYSGQAGANIGNAIGNAIAARRFYRGQQNAAAFAWFLTTHSQTDLDAPLQPGQSRTIVASFEQAKRKKKPFDVKLRLADDTFTFEYKE